MAEKRVAVIGAGSSGLPAIKACIDEGLTPVCFERTDAVGGIWHYTDTVHSGQGCVMKSTISNTSKEMSSFSDYPMPDHFPNFVPHKRLLRYFEMYAEKFDLLKHIMFNTEIISVSKTNNFAETGQWNVTVADRKTGKETTDILDAVLVCTGHHTRTKIPKYEGQEEFQGKLMHSHDYRSPGGFEDKRVVVVGIGSSATDIAAEISTITEQTFISTRRGAWITHRVWDDGLPSDMANRTRYKTLLWSIFPTNWMNTSTEGKLQRRFRHDYYDLKPKHRYSAQQPTVNDALPACIMGGDIVVKPDIRRFTKTGVEFVNGTSEDNIDVVVFATGYIFGFPFIDKSVIDVKDNKIKLFKYCFPVELEKPTMAIIGCIQPLGSIWNISELQSRWATRVFKGLLKLPPRSEMTADIQCKAKTLSDRYVDSTRHTIQVDWIPYMDEIAEQMGVKPDLNKLFFSDPVLAIKCFFGPCTPYQYRLQGPGQWPGARQAIMTQWDRCIPVNKDCRPRRKAKNRESSFIYASAAVIFAILMCVLLRKL